MRRVSSIFSILFTVAGIATCVAALYLYHYPPVERRVEVQEPERELTQVLAGEKLTLAFAIHNPTWHTARVVGLTECCGGKNCCFRAQRQPPFDLPAGGVATLDCLLETFEPGPFAGQIHIFLDDGGLREIVLKVHGQAKAAESTHEGTSP
jgi:hypothetical protein